MKKIALKILFASIIVAGIFIQSNAQTVAVSASITKGSLKSGAVGKGSIMLEIPTELHTNSNKPSSEFLIPTTVRLRSNQIKSFRIIYPKGKDRKFEFSEQSLNVYEGNTKIMFSFKVPQGFKGKAISIKAKVTYQACSNEVCYPPQTKELTLRMNVR